MKVERSIASLARCTPMMSDGPCVLRGDGLFDKFEATALS